MFTSLHPETLQIWGKSTLLEGAIAIRDQREKKRLQISGDFTSGQRIQID